MIKFELIKENQQALVSNITADHLKSTINVIEKAPPCPTFKTAVEFELTNDDAEALIKEIAIIASEHTGMEAMILWLTSDAIEATLKRHVKNKDSIY
jgi:hypothetical protein